MITGGCGSVLIRRDIKWGVDNGFLAEPYFIVRQVATGGRDFKDDKLKSYKEHVLNNQQMKSRIESDALAMINAGKSVLILVDEVAHGEELSKALGIPFATGLDKKSQEYVDQLNAGKIPGLVGTDGKVGEGTDTKNVDVLILANFVAAKGPVIQAVGRGLRKQGTKDKCLILDYVPLGSTMLTRHANNRIEYYLEITDKVKLVTI
jgi:superfamily II DNA or RNA helicase